MGPHEFEPQQTHESEDTCHGSLDRSVGCDENEYFRQKYPPAALDHLVVVQVGPWASINCGNISNSFNAFVSIRQNSLHTQGLVDGVNHGETRATIGVALIGRTVAVLRSSSPDQLPVTSSVLHAISF